MSGNQDAWRDLVARLELPPYLDPAAAPWPARENLGTAASQPAPADADPVQPPSAGQPESAAGSGASSAAGGRPDRGTGADRSRVIRPATFLPFAPEPPAPVAPPPGARSVRPGVPREQAGDEDGEASYLEYDLDAEFADYDDSDDRYVPPPVPAPPRLDPVARGAWAALFGGPGYLFVATLLSWEVPGWAELTAIIAFVAGFTVLVFRLGDGPSRRDGPDQGAVV